MNLKTQLSFLDQDKSGRSIRIKDSTGFKSYGRTSGYDDGIISGIIAYYFTVSRMFDSVTYQMKLDNSNPYIPTIEQFARGYALELTPELFKYEGERGSLEPTCVFYDGLLDVNSYATFAGATGVTISKGTNFIYGPDGTSFTEQLSADAIVVNDEIYMIDKGPDVDTNGNTLIYILGQFEEDATSFNVAYRANLKILLKSMSENLHDYATSLLRNNVDHPDWQKINVAMAFRRAAEGFFKDDGHPDYAKADDLIQAGYKLLNKFAL